MLPPLFKQFVAPAFDLRRDCFYAAGLFDGPCFNLLGIIVAQLRLRQLLYGMGGLFVETLVEHFEHFNGGA